jgi:hypothetical protein
MAKASDDSMPSLTIWAVSDGRAGIEAQALGLAEAVARLRPAEVLVKRIGWKAGIGRLPWRLNLAPRLALSADSAIAPPWPDIWIAAGRATLPLSTRARRWSGGRSFVVQTQDPRADLGRFDLVIPPAHDGLEGPNVFPIAGAPNRLHPDRMAGDLARFAERIEPLPHPRIALIVGGRSKAFDLPPDRAAQMADAVAKAIETSGGSLLLSFTRRTPDAARRILSERLRHLPGWLWDGTGENPYFAFLAAADAVLVTEESANLATDAAATGKPVHVLAMSGRSDKFARFHADLARRGVTRPFTGSLDLWTYDPLDETGRAARELLRRYDARSSTAA